MTKLIVCYLKITLLLAASVSGCSVLQTETKTEDVPDANLGKIFDLRFSLRQVVPMLKKPVTLIFSA